MKLLDQLQTQSVYQIFADSSRSNVKPQVVLKPRADVLRQANELGAGIFWTVQETDGTGRKASNITRIRALFLDLDGAELESDWPVPPSLIVESSPYRYHVYWSVYDYPALPAAQAQYHADQLRLAEMFGGDTSVVDVARVMRVPGYHHNKTEVPFRSRVIVENENSYSYVEMIEAFGLEAVREDVVEEVSEDAASAATLSIAPHADDEVTDAVISKMLEDADMALGRNNVIFKIACQLRDNGVAVESALAGLLRASAYMHGDHALGVREIAATVRSAYSREQRSAWPSVEARVSSQDTAPHRTPPPAGTGSRRVRTLGHRSDSSQEDAEAREALTISRIFLTTTGYIFKYYMVDQSWYRYDSGCYKRVGDNVVTYLVDIFMSEHLGRASSPHLLAGVLRMIKHREDVAILDEVAEQETAHLVNCRNGIYDLHTRKFMDHTPDIFLRQQLACDFDPDAECPHWHEFLNFAIPDHDHRAALHQYFGYCLSSDISAQKSLLLIGEGGTGKSTIATTISGLFGTYSSSSSMTNMLDGGFLMEPLLGARLCVVSELPKKFEWDTFKRISGGDAITINPKNKTPYAARLSAKFIILSNTMPNLGQDSSNNSVTRRLCIIPLDRVPDEVDVFLDRKLAAERSGILNWLLGGAVRHRVAGGLLPSGSSSHSRELAAASNHCVDFLEILMVGDEYEISCVDLYAYYVPWCNANGYYAYNSRNFPRQLEHACSLLGLSVNRKLIRRGSNVIKAWVGLKI